MVKKSKKVKVNEVTVAEVSSVEVAETPTVETAEINTAEVVETPANYRKDGVTLGDCYAKHLAKYPGATEADYIEFSKRTARKVTISRLDSMICEQFKIYTIAHLMHIQTELPEGVEQSRVDDIIQATINPYDLARMWKDLRADAAAHHSAMSVINSQIQAIRKEDFEKWGDKNWLPDVAKKWFDEKAMPLDAKVETISEEFGFHISENDVIEFAKNNKPGAWQNPETILLKKVEDRFKEVVGFSIKDYYAEHLIASCEYRPYEVLEVPF